MRTVDNLVKVCGVDLK